MGPPFPFLPSGVRNMSNRDLPALDAEIATMPHKAFAARLAAAYRDGDRDEFIRLGQRLVWGAVRKFYGDRLRPWRSDMQSVGVLGLIEFFDGPRRRLSKNAFSYFRRVARYSILTWLYSQHLIRRPKAKHADVVADSETIAYVGRTDTTPLPGLGETIALCLGTLAKRNRAEKLRHESFVLDRDAALARVGLRWIGHAG
jgi:hypothetical protein